MTHGIGYRTSKGRPFSHDYVGPTPVELFDEGRYAESAHACVYLLRLFGDEHRAFAAMEDDAYLHELLHLAVGTNICTHNSMTEIRKDLESLWADTEALRAR